MQKYITRTKQFAGTGEENSKELYEQYQKKLSMEGKSAEEVIERIYQEMEKTLDKSYAEVEDMLLGLAALYGHTICWDDRGEWI